MRDSSRKHMHPICTVCNSPSIHLLRADCEWDYTLTQWVVVDTEDSITECLDCDAVFTHPKWVDDKGFLMLNTESGE